MRRPDHGVAPADPDARLLAAVADFHAAGEELVTLSELAGANDIDPAALDAINHKTDAAISVAAGVSARTCAGLRAKAEMVQVQLPKELDGGWLPGDAAASRLLVSFCQDVLRMVPEPPR